MSEWDVVAVSTEIGRAKSAGYVEAVRNNRKFQRLAREVRGRYAVDVWQAWAYQLDTTERFFWLREKFPRMVDSEESGHHLAACLLDILIAEKIVTAQRAGLDF